MAKVEIHAIVSSDLDDAETMIRDVDEYGYFMKDLQQAQKEIKQFDAPDSLKIIKITVEDIEFDWRADVEADKTDDAMNRMKEAAIDEVK